MKITAVKILHAGAGPRNYSFVKVETDEGLVGWSEYTEAVGNAGTTAAIDRLAELLVGADPLRISEADSLMYTRTVPAWSGIAAHARAALTNALLDIKGKAFGVPVADLFGGRLRDRIPLYWSHCGNARIRTPRIMQLPKLTTYEELSDLTAECRERGYKALKMNIFAHDGERFQTFAPGHGWSEGFPALNLDRETIQFAIRQIEAARKGAGDDFPLMLDLNYNFKLEGFLKILRALEPYDLEWAELDKYDPTSVALMRERTRVPIASGESLYGLAEYRPYFERAAMDVAVVDVIWNGYLQSANIATLADAYDTNVAPHNFYGPLADCISAQFAAATPNFRIMEYEVEDVPWRHDLVTHPPVVENGEMLVPNRPGWGTDINEAAVAAHPPV